MKLGIDVGGVIIDRINDKTDTSFFGHNYLATTACPDAFECIRKLTREHFGIENVYLVSKAREKTEKRTKEWLVHHKFYDITGIKPENVYVCRDRDGKAPICKDLGITYFIDDRLEVLGYLTTVENLYLFQGRSKEIEKHKEHLERVVKVDNWRDVTSKILGY
jgi:hypothetical protein